MTNSTRIEKKQLREEQILRVAQELARECGFLTLNVGEVAKESGVSVGTLYSHFQSKEGLVAALAVHALRGRLATFTDLVQREKLEPAEKLVVIVFADFLFSLDHPELFAAEQLAASTAVLKAMPGGVFQWIPPDLISVNRVKQAAGDAIDAGDFAPWKDRSKQAAAVDRGVWTLMAGSSYIWNVTEASRPDVSEVQIPEWLRQNACALFQGYGWKEKHPEKAIERLANYSMKRARFLAPECRLSTDQESQ